ncbi:uncharacterized protein LOC141628459 [Silene latifolia]|uniref:uncharacterized protein LOC141628459 n=1 Tax=Silene latifolia TaxID=37657 RepID=UPI003D783A01
MESKQSWGGPPQFHTIAQQVVYYERCGAAEHNAIVCMAENDEVYAFKQCRRGSHSYGNHSELLEQQRKKGSPMFSLFEKLKSVKYALTKFYKENFSNISLRVKNAKTALVECQRMLIADPFSADLIHKEKMLVASYSHLKKIDSKYFFAKVCERQHQQVIGAIKDQQGQLHTDSPSVNQAFQNYYRHLLGTSSEVPDLDWDFISSGTTVTSDSSTDLTKDITTKEIRNAVFGMDSNSSPGLDAFSAGFFKSA